MNNDLKYIKPNEKNPLYHYRDGKQFFCWDENWLYVSFTHHTTKRNVFDNEVPVNFYSISQNIPKMTYSYSYVVEANTLYESDPAHCTALSRQGLYSRLTASLQAARLDVITIVSLCNLTGISAALLPRCLSNFRAVVIVYDMKHVW